MALLSSIKSNVWKWQLLLLTIEASELQRLVIVSMDFVWSDLFFSFQINPLAWCVKKLCCRVELKCDAKDACIENSLIVVVNNRTEKNLFSNLNMEHDCVIFSLNKAARLEYIQMPGNISVCLLFSLFVLLSHLANSSSPPFFTHFKSPSFLWEA